MRNILLKTKGIVLALLCLFSMTAQGQTVTIGSTSGTTSYFYGPYYRSSSGSVFNYSNYAYLYEASELNIPPGSMITDVAWLKASGTITGSNTFNIYMENSSATTLGTSATWGTISSTATSVYTSTTQSFIAAANTYESFTLAAPFIYNGGSLIILTEHVMTGTATAANNFYTNTATGKSLGVANSIATTSTTNLTSVSYGNTRPTIQITYVPGTACSGAPNPGTANASVSAACPGQPFSLSATGLTAASALSFQWQESLGGLGSFTDIPGATNISYTVSAGITTPMDYQIVTTCANGGQTATSTPVNVTVQPFYNCYCASYANYTADGEIYNVTIGTLNNTSTCTQTGGPGSMINQYSDYTATVTPTPLMQGISYPLSVTAGACNGYPYDAWVKVWIDFDQDGQFTGVGEEVFSGTTTSGQYTPAGDIASGLIAIPATALTGTTRMRVILWQSNSATPVVPCQSGSPYNYGETEDYLVDILAGVACSGQPDPVTISMNGGGTSVCASTDFTLTATGMTMGLGISYQWEMYDLLTSTWTPIVGETNIIYNVTGGITMPTDYRFVTTCANGGQTDISGTFSLALNSPTLCYCTPTYTYSCTSGDDIDDFILVGDIAPGINNTNTPCPPAPGNYSDFTAMSATLSAGFPYSGNVTTNYTGVYEDVRIWIDYGMDGFFDPADEIAAFGPINNASTGAFSFVVPPATPPGAYRLRVRLVYNVTPSSIDPCNNYGYGETHDYTVNIVTPPACSGAPNPVTVTGPTDVCSGTDFTLTATNVTLASGISYQWEMYDLLTSTWTPIAGETNAIYNAVGGITMPTDYRFITTCANGGQTDVSPTYTVNMSPFYGCYCASYANYTADGEIYNVTIGTLNNTSTCAQTGGPGSMMNQYSDYTATITPTPLMQGVTYPVSVTAGACNGYPYDAWVKVWIDLDQDGQFTGVGEEVFSGTTTSGQYTPAGDIAAGNIAIPATALTGTTRMRVILWQSNSASPVVPCQSGSPYNYGETEDYLVDILAGISCSGQPNAVTISMNGGGTSVCAANDFALSASNMTMGLGITYQWEMYDLLTSAWIPIAGETNLTYNVTGGIMMPTDYRFITTCANGGQTDISNTLSITLNPPTGCYCTPTYLYGGGADYIADVQLGSLVNNTSAAGNPSPYYVDYTSQQPGTLAIPDLAQSLTYNLSVSFGGDGNQYSRVWVDFNQDGIFDATESFTTGSNAGANGTALIPINVPLTALLGNTRMRIRGADDSQPADTQPCGASNSSYGEAEDYIVNIIAAPTCLPPTTVVATSTLATTANATWTASISSPANGYEWVVFPQGSGPTGTPVASGTELAGATSATVTSGLSGNTAYTFYVRAVCSASDQSPWVSSNFTTPCAAYTAPWTYDVESQPANTNGVMTDCWSATKMPASSFYMWNVTSSGTTPSLATGPSSANSGTHYFFTEASSGANGDTALLVSPQVDVSSLTLPMLQFYYHMLGNQINRIYITVFNGTTWNVVDSIIGAQQAAETDPWLQRSILLTGYTGIVQIGFVAISGGTYEGDISIDDISVIDAPTCPKPTSPITSNETLTSADLDWTSNSSATQYEIEYGQGTSFALGTGTRVGPAGVTKPHTLGGLTSATQYSFFVREICAPGDTSAWSSRTTFTTAYPVPPNDDCIGAIDISNGLITSGYVNNATQSEPACDATPTANDVWYVFTTGATTTSATINANTAATGTDLVMQVYSGACGTLTAMTPTSSSGLGTSCIDGPAAGLEYGTYTVTPSTTYYVRVYGYNGAQGTFDIQLVIPPANDNCANAVTVPLNQTFTSWTSANTAGATMDSPFPGYTCWSSSNDDDVWYTFTTPAATTGVDVTLNFSNYTYAGTTNPGGVGIGLFTGCSGTPDLGGTITCVIPASATGTGSLTFPGLAPSTTYLLPFMTSGTGVSISFDFYLTYNWLLAIKLKDIIATNVGEYNRVNWITAEEKKGDYFELERSADGKEFTKVSSQKANGEASTYTYVDQQPFSGKTFYRLKMYEANGKYEYSKIVWATMDGKSEFSVRAYPNPVGNDELTVVAYGTDGNNATVMITDITGKVIKAVTMNNGIATIDMNGMAQGIYLVKYTDSHNSETIKVNKQ